MHILGTIGSSYYDPKKRKTTINRSNLTIVLSSSKGFKIRNDKIGKSNSILNDVILLIEVSKLTLDFRSLDFTIIECSLMIFHSVQENFEAYYNSILYEPKVIVPLAGLLFTKDIKIYRAHTSHTAVDYILRTIKSNTRSTSYKYTLRTFSDFFIRKYPVLINTKTELVSVVSDETQVMSLKYSSMKPEFRTTYLENFIHDRAKDVRILSHKMVLSEFYIKTLSSFDSKISYYNLEVRAVNLFFSEDSNDQYVSRKFLLVFMLLLLKKKIDMFIRKNSFNIADKNREYVEIVIEVYKKSVSRASVNYVSDIFILYDS